MNFLLQHPKEQLISIMKRIYGYEMTTTSGGNLSIYDDEGNIWITPSAIDKGSLRPEDIMCIDKDNIVHGVHKPSSEYPFHKAIYAKRSDIRAIFHAQPPPLVAFSIVRKIPDTQILPQAHAVCGEVGYAPYRIPGSEELGDIIAQKFFDGYNVVLLENHGVVTGGQNLLQAFQRFETLDFCARTIIQSSILGSAKPLTDEQIRQFEDSHTILPEFKLEKHSSRELELRQHICQVIHRAYDQRLMTSTEGSASTRIDESSFLITPYGIDRRYIDIEDIVMIQDGKREKGKTPSRATRLHINIYNNHPEIGAIVSTQSPYATAYSVAGKKFDTRTIPESYIVLRDIPLVPFGQQLGNGQSISDILSKDTPVILIQNDAILTTGENLIQAFDRLEVAEFSAKSLSNADAIGKLIPIGDEDIARIQEKFFKQV